MANRISILVALEGADDGLKRTLDNAERSLADLAASAKAAGAKASAGLAEVKAGASAFSEQIATAKTQLLAFATLSWAADKLHQIVQVADAWNSMTARLKLATAGQREFTVAQSALFDIAQRIGVPLHETATLYGRLQQAVRMLGLEQKDALAITESVSQALRISGASSSEAQGALLQFGQALSAGVLRGEEFNSVVENSPRLAQALADGLNVPIGRLRKLAEEGRLTGDVVVNALLSQKERLAAEYAELPQTVGQAFERLSNAFGRWVHRVDEATGFSTKLSQALTWLADHLDDVLRALQRVGELGLAVLAYRLIPAAITAWQTLGAVAVASASSVAAAWATVRLPLSAAVQALGALRVAFGVLAAFVAGWEVGTYLSDNFAVVRQAGIALVQVLMTHFEQLRYAWELFAAVFTADTLAAATQRHQARLAEMQRIFGEMRADAAASSTAAGQAAAASAAAAEEIAKRLEAVRQGTQEAVGRGVEAVHAAIDKLKSRLGEVEQALGAAQQVASDSTSKMAEAYRGLSADVAASLQRQVDAVKSRYAQEQSELERSRLSQAAQLMRGTELLAQALTQQTALRQRASAEALRLIDDESRARLEAARRQGQTEDERRANVQRVENEILAARRQTLTEALAEYRQHVDALNAEANRHLSEVQRIEAEKRQLAMSTDERIREIQRQGMSEYAATEDRKRQISELQSQARQAIAQGEFEQARQFAQKAIDLAAQVASSQTSEAQRAEAARKQAEQNLTQVVQLEAQARDAARRGESDRAAELLRQAQQLREQMTQKAREADDAIARSKGGVGQAIEAIRKSEELLAQSLDVEAKAHQQAARSALDARAQIQQALTATTTEIDHLTERLQQGLKLTIDADATRLDKALADIDKAITERERLMVIKADLEQVDKQLQDLERQLKDGKTLLVNADVSRARSALQQLNAYASESGQIELKVATDKAQAAIGNVQSQLEALSRIQTESTHSIRSNADAARAEVLSLDGINTTSTHTIVVRQVLASATGGLVPPMPLKLARGGEVPYAKLSSGVVPGSGTGDTVPRTLDAGSFVLRRAAVQHYGRESLQRLARFALGGRVDPRATNTPPPKRNREAGEALKMIDLGLDGMDRYLAWEDGHHVGFVEFGSRERTMSTQLKQAQVDRTTIEGFIERPQLTTHERQELDRIKRYWRECMSQPLAWGEDLERQLIDYMQQHQAEFFGRGGVARSDVVPALLTPGEFVVNKQAVQRHGVGLFEALNQLAVPARWLKQRITQPVQGFAAGGAVAGIAARASRVVGQLPIAGMSGSELSAALAQSIGAVLRPPSLAGALSSMSPTGRSVRVELASGSQRVDAHIDERDEARLLDLLKQARSRAT